MESVRALAGSRHHVDQLRDNSPRPNAKTSASGNTAIRDAFIVVLRQLPPKRRLPVAQWFAARLMAGRYELWPPYGEATSGRGFATARMRRTLSEQLGGRWNVCQHNYAQHIDHDHHDTGLVRGYLCFECNRNGSTLERNRTNCLQHNESHVDGTFCSSAVVFSVMATTDDDDFAAYASGRWASLVRSATLLGCSRADAEDLAQTALIKAWRRWPTIRALAEPDAYVYRILINSLSTSKRRRWHGEHPTAEMPEPYEDDQTDQVNDRQQVLNALRSLPVEQQRVLTLRYVADLSERSTAEILNVPVGTVKSRAARGLATLYAISSETRLQRRET